MSYYYTVAARTLRHYIGNPPVTSGEGPDAVANNDDYESKPNGQHPIKKKARPSLNEVFTPPEATAEPSSSPGTSAAVATSSVTASVSSRVLFQSGTSIDPYNPSQNNRIPLLVFCPCMLPTLVDEVAVQESVAKLEQYAQQPYLLVIFASPSPSVAIQRLVQAYRSLSSHARRNVKRIWVCHPGLFTRLAVRLFLNAIVSGKVAQKGKVRLVDSLSALARDIDIAHINIPYDVLMHNATVESRIILPPHYAKPAVFGRPLEKMTSPSDLPVVVTDCLALLSQTESLHTVGIFRKVPRMSALDQLRDAYERGQPITLDEWPDGVILAASLLKLFLRSLPTPLLPASLYANIRGDYSSDVDAAWIRTSLLPALEQQHPDGLSAVILLRAVFGLLSKVAAYSEVNRMTASNLVIIFLPVLVYPTFKATDTDANPEHKMDISVESLKALASLGSNFSGSGDRESISHIITLMIADSECFMYEEDQLQNGTMPAAWSSNNAAKTSDDKSAASSIFAGSPSKYRTLKTRSTQSPERRQHVEGLFAMRQENGH